MIAASAKPKATKRSTKAKPCYTRDDLESIKLVDLRKLVTTAVPIDLRKGIKQKDMDKNLIIDLILKAQTHT